MKETVAIIAAFLAMIGNVPYLTDVIRGRVKPHAYTWFVWTIVSAITFLGQLAKGAGVGALPAAVSEIFTICIFLFSLKYGFRAVIKADTYFLLLALAGVILWIMTKDPTGSVVIAVAIDLIAFVPTLRKAWENPKTENAMLYGMNVLRHILTLFSLQAYSIATTLHSIAMIGANSLMTGFLITKRGVGSDGE